MQKTGRVEYYTPSKGYGFIRPDDGTADLFFHVSAVVEGVVLMPGHLVKYVERPSKRRDGSFEAQDVLLI
jgi:cold shock protein